jgi:hypothetical protein
VIIGETNKAKTYPNVEPAANLPKEPNKLPLVIIDLEDI